MDIFIDMTGGVRHIYSDELNLAGLGLARVQRASHVEPDAVGRWLVDLSPVRGPTLGPFVKRADALAAEAAWLEQHGLPLPTPV